MFQRILVALDVNRVSLYFLQGVAQWAQAFGARLILLHVVPHEEFVPPSLQEIFSQTTQRVRAEMDQRLTEIAERIQQNFGVPVESTWIRMGVPYEEVVAGCQDQGCDLIAVGYRLGETSEDLGSTAYRILTRAQVPVLVYPHREPREIQRILVPVDLSPLSLRALERAFEVASVFKAQVVVLHVIELLESLAAQEAQERIQREVEQILRERIRTVSGTVTYRIRIERRYEALPGILDAVEQEQPDLVVMASHGRAGFKHWLMGSVTEKVLRSVEVPVLVWKPKGA